MRVLLINSVSYYVKQKAAIPLALLSISTYLSRNGHTVQIYDRTIEGGNIKKHLKSFSPDIVGISSPGGMSFDDAIKVSKVVKKNNIPVVWGGQIPTLIPELVLKTGFVDFVIMGDGEMILLDLINAIAEKTSLHDIDGLAFVEKGETIINKERALVDLSLLPIIDFSFVDAKKYYFRNMECKKMLHIYTSKGCIGKCTYCYSPGYSKCEWRPRPSEYFISEIKYLLDNFNIDGIYFVDDLLSPNKEHLFSLCDKLIESKLGLLWSCDMRTDICTKENLQKMYDAGCRWIFFGIESGSQQRQKSIKKRLDLEKTKETIDYCNEIGIWTTTSFMIGFPDETEAELRETLEFVREINSKVKLAALFGPIPKSEMYDDLLKNRKIEAPQSYKDWGKLATIDTIGKNFSNVPTIELKVITNWFLFSTFKTKTVDKEKGVESRIWVKRLLGLIIDILKRGNLKSIYIILLSAKEFFEIIFYATMFPKIRKKYDLKKSSNILNKSK